MSIEKTVCSWCEANKDHDTGRGPHPHHGRESPHCQYCGQPLGDNTPVGGVRYQGQEYFGHVKCVYQSVGPLGELYLRRLASGEATPEEISTHNTVVGG